jgi:predicted TIM-barrel fold metal-dependent hydrolase
MATIDADAHVIETDRTWDYLEPSEQKYRPRAVADRGEPFWLIDGRVHLRRRNVGSDTTVGTQELLDLEGRLQHMDELGIDTQVLYPTLFLIPITKRPEVEIALCKSYNRWLAEVWAESDGRLRWAVVLPLLDMDESLKELRWAKEHGACAIFMRGIEGDRLAADPYFHPLYAEASRLNIPPCFHAATGSFTHWELCGNNSIHKFKFPVVGAFHNLYQEGIPQRFPELRVGFVEASAQWVPWLVHYLKRNAVVFDKEISGELVRDARFYITCQNDDDIPYVLRYAGEDNLIIGTDYGHHDTSAEIEALRVLREKGEVPGPVIDKILFDNPRALYGL